MTEIAKYLDTINMKRADPTHSQQHLRNIMMIHKGYATAKDFAPKPKEAANGPDWRKGEQMAKVSHKAPPNPIPAQRPPYPEPAPEGGQYAALKKAATEAPTPAPESISYGETVMDDGPDEAA